MATTSAVLNAVDRYGVGVRVAYEMDGDRFRHTIYGVRGPRTEPLLVSAESPPNITWPISPPLQQLHVQEDGTGGKLLFLTGMAGQSHWSVSVSVQSANREVGSDFDQAPATMCLAFDAAVRVKQPPELIGSTYEVCGDAKWLDMVGFTSACKPPFAAAISGSLQGLVAPSEKLFVTSPPNSPACRRFASPSNDAQNPPTTIRWQYWIWWPLN